MDELIKPNKRAESREVALKLIQARGVVHSWHPLILSLVGHVQDHSSGKRFGTDEDVIKTGVLSIASKSYDWPSHKQSVLTSLKITETSLL